MRARKISLGLSLVLSLELSCVALEQDEFASRGGIAPDPSAAVEGTILYTGPRPTCVYDASGVARIVGNVVLSMYAFDDPPAPEGTATSAVNLLALSGDELFAPTDCLAPGASPNYDDVISRSAPFLWPRLPLAAGAQRYQIRGFFDYDEDFIPFFSVTRAPTAGDIVGAALNDVQNPARGLYALELPSAREAPQGVVQRGMTVALGSPVWTERPVFRLNAQRSLAADVPFEPVVSLDEGGALAVDGSASLQSFRALTCSADQADTCGLTLERIGAADAPKLAAGAVELDVDSNFYRFFSRPVDFRTVLAGMVDVQAPDGLPDPHPVLGGLGIPWFTPMVIMRRTPRDPLSAAREQEARIPQVLMVGSVLLDDAGAPLASSFAAAPIAVPPVAIVELYPGHPECRVPYFAPATSETLLSGRVAQCAELPTGEFAVNVFAGIAGGQPEPATNEQAVDISGGRFSGQSWSIPNELAVPANVGGPQNALDHQGFDGTFIVHDPSPGAASCGTSPRFELCGETLLVAESPRDGLDIPTCLPPLCCDPVRHLCGIPVCASVSLPDGRRVAASPTQVTRAAGSGAPLPDCVPFAIPPQCCPPT